MAEKEVLDTRFETHPQKNQNPALFCFTTITICSGLLMILVFGLFMFYGLMLYLAGEEYGLTLSIYCLVFAIFGFLPLIGGIIIFKSFFKSVKFTS